MKTLKSSLKFSVVEITPEDAKVLLSKYLRNRLLSVRGQDKQKTVTDMWNKYISSKENIRVNITSAIIFK